MNTKIRIGVITIFDNKFVVFLNKENLKKEIMKIKPDEPEEVLIPPTIRELFYFEEKYNKPITTFYNDDPEEKEKKKRFILGNGNISSKTNQNGKLTKEQIIKAATKGIIRGLLISFTTSYLTSHILNRNSSYDNKDFTFKGYYAELSSDTMEKKTGYSFLKFFYIRLYQ